MANVWSVLNTCMDDVTYAQLKRTKRDTAQTDAWIAQQKITAEQIGDVDTATCL